MTEHRGTRWRLALVLVVLLAALAACGSDDDGDDGASEATTDESSDVVTVKHLYGTTEIEAAPERIVALDAQWADVLVALDVTPVGHAGQNPSDPNGLFEWQGELVEATALDAQMGALPFEQIAALEPDLIVGSWLISDEAEYEKLSQIAPTIGLLGDGQVDSWQDMAAAAGTFLQREDDAEQLVAEVQDDVAAVREELAGLEGKTYTLSQYIPGDGIYVVADPDDGSSRFFADLGLVMAPEVIAAGEDQSAPRPKFSGERVDILSADVVAFYTPVDEATIRQELPGFDQLPSVLSGAMARTSFSVISAMNTPSPLSIGYALDELRPHLEAAAG